MRSACAGSEAQSVQTASASVSRVGDGDTLVHAAGTNVNVELVRRGAAAPYFRQRAEGRRAAELLDAVAEAREARRGMWGECRVTWVADQPVLTRTG